jgi:hypothetical protein
LVDGLFSGGGPIYFHGRACNFNSNILEDLDSNDNFKFALIIASESIFNDNKLKSGAINGYANSRLVTWSNAGIQKITANDNILINTSISSIERGFHSDFVTVNSTMLGNTFSGNFTASIDINFTSTSNCLVPNNGFGPKMSSGTSIPGVGAWNAGDIIWNSGITNATGQPIGFVCVTSGSPGTWRNFGVTL